MSTVNELLVLSLNSTKACKAHQQRECVKREHIQIRYSIHVPTLYKPKRTDYAGGILLVIPVRSVYFHLIKCA